MLPKNAETDGLPCLRLVRSHEITLAYIQSVMAQDCVRRRDMKEELWQRIVQEVCLACKFFLLRGTHIR